MKTYVHLPSPASTITIRFTLFLNSLIISVNSTYYCNVGSADPCTTASSLFEPYARTTNCPYDGTVAPCDRYITPGWYTADDVILDQCPVLNSCGAVYPVWMNGTFPLVSDGVVTRTLCKTGFEGCCVRDYDLQIKNCGSHYVYCIPALDTCPERICFGTNGSCEYPTTTTTPTVTTESDSDEKVPIKEYRDLESRYVAIIVVVVILLIIGVTATITVAVRKFYKLKSHREISQSRTELVGEREKTQSITPVESNYEQTPPYVDFNAFG
uniref:Oncoprotein-induced transcript 3 protein-like n=1 Tax=Crassostrea virginica TaxID=6565 RepID=A0A8B8CPJ0_CRAVI|nr:oncoprotein-induced transcript 3 protein-like [Crassostrea virginica]